MEFSRPIRLILALGAASLICISIPAADVHAAIGPGARAKIDASVAQRPTVGGGSVRAINGHSAVVRLAIRYPDLPRGERRRATVVVYRKPASERPVSHHTYTVPLERGRVGRLRAVFDGGAGRRLATAVKRGGQRPGRRALRLVEVEVKHGRDLFQGHGIDHVWHFTERGPALARGVRPAPSKPAARRSSGILTRTIDVTVSSGQPESVLLSSGGVTCTDGADALNGTTVGGGGPSAQTMNVTLHDGGIVGTNLGVGTNRDTAADLWSPEGRTFAFEMNMAYSPWAVEAGLEHGLKLRYNGLLGIGHGLPSIAEPCVSAASTFLVGADGVSSGDHATDIYKVGGAWHDLAVEEFPGGELGQAGFQLTAGDVSHGLGEDKVTIDVDDGAGPGQLSGVCPDPRSWMQCRFQNGDDVPLWDVTFPGSHDSATVNLGQVLETDETGGCSHLSQPLAALGDAITRNWAVSQTLNVREQLEAGVRYLDFRAAYAKGDWWPIHSLLSQSDLRQEVDTVAAWAKQHPQEIVILDLNHICPLDGGSGQTMELLLEEFGARVPYYNVGLCDVSYPIRTDGDEVSSDLMSRTVADVRKTGRNVIVLLDAGPGNGPYQPPGTGGDFSWDEQGLDRCGYGLERTPTANGNLADRYVPAFDLWPNQAGPAPILDPNQYGLCADPGAAESDNRAIEAYPFNPTPNAQVPPGAPTLDEYTEQKPIPLMQTQMLYTLPTDAAGYLPLLETPCPGSLLDWGLSLHSDGAPYNRADILAAWGSRTNVVIADSVDTPYISQAAALNPSGRFYLANGFASGIADIEASFGELGDIPVTGDWDRSGTDTIGVYRPSTQAFYLVNGFSSATPDIEAPFGDPGDIPVTGDWNGDGTDTIGVYRPGAQAFFLSDGFSSGAADIEASFGDPGDIPVTGDWNGDGTDTIGVYRPSTQTFYPSNSLSSALADAEVQFGDPGDIPVTGDWNGDGTDTIGVYRPSTQTFYLRNSLSSGAPDIQRLFGDSLDTPVTGDWNGDRVETIGVYR